MNKRFVFIFILFSFFIPFVHVSAEESALADLSIRYTNEETNFVAVIEDNADLLTEEEENMLLNQMISLTEYGHIIFLSINDNPTTTKNYISDYYHDHFNTDSGSIFLIDMDNRQIYLFSDGNNFNIVREDKAYSITDNVYRYAKKGDYYSCVNEAFIQVEKILTGHKIAEPMRLASNIVISLIISFLLSFLYVLSQTKIRRVPEISLRKNYNVQLTTGKITKEKTGESKEYSPRSDYDSWGGSSGGGFSGGGGGGGGFSGGGGGGFSGGGGSSSGGGGGHSF